LLAYLACTQPIPQQREKLATMLWGSHFEAQARQNLRQALSRLRRVSSSRLPNTGGCAKIVNTTWTACVWPLASAVTKSLADKCYAR
jgi:hypothetical protein